MRGNGVAGAAPIKLTVELLVGEVWLAKGLGGRTRLRGSR